MLAAKIAFYAITWTAWMWLFLIIETGGIFAVWLNPSNWKYLQIPMPIIIAALMFDQFYYDTNLAPFCILHQNIWVCILYLLPPIVMVLYLHQLERFGYHTYRTDENLVEYLKVTFLTPGQVNYAATKHLQGPMAQTLLESLNRKIERLAKGQQYNHQLSYWGKGSYEVDEDGLATVPCANCGENNYIVHEPGMYRGKCIACNTKMEIYVTEKFLQTMVTLEKPRYILGPPMSISLAEAYVTRGILQRIFNQFREAMESFDESKKLLSQLTKEQTCNASLECTASLHYGYGEIAQAQDNITDAIAHYKKCEEIYRLLGWKDNVEEVRTAIAVLSTPT